MMKHEFETLLGCEVSPEEYEKIEAVYMWLDDFSKDDIVHLFRHNEKLVLETLYKKISAFERISQRNIVLEHADSNLEAIKIRNSVLNTDNENLRLENYDLRKENHELQFANDIYKRKIANKDCRIDELEKQLQNYRVLFNDIESIVSSR